MENTELPVVARAKDLDSSGVSWGAVIAGAVAGAALSLIMLALGAGFGLSVVSPWSNIGASASAVGAAAIIWLLVMHMTTSAMAGYLAGRLRSRWLSIHTDEVHFRDTAHGLVTWAVGVLITVSFLAAAAKTMAGVTPTSGEDTKTAAISVYEPDAYFIDRLFRTDHPAMGDKDLSPETEVSRILAHAAGDTSASDTTYLTQLVAARTGLSPNAAEQRVTQTIADVRQAEDQARRATAHALLWIFIALLAGAFCASYAATIGGRQRDSVRHI